MNRTIDLSQFENGKKFDGSYVKELNRLHIRLHALQQMHIAHKSKALIIVEGWHGAGKGEVIQLFSSFLDPCYMQVHLVGAPSTEEQDKHFLWRFWNKLPGGSEIIVLDNSYYGRVLRKRVEGICSPVEWRRAYDEINEFEAQQADIGTNIIKLFLHITPERQDAVLKERLADETRCWSVTEAAFTQRGQRDIYLEALGDMFDQTNNRWAPWCVIDANNQKAGHIAILRHIVAQLEARLPKEFPTVNPEVKKLAKRAFR